MVMVGYGHQSEEAVIYIYQTVAYFKIKSAMGVERRDKSSALFHIMLTRLETFTEYSSSDLMCDHTHRINGTILDRTFSTNTDRYRL